MSGEHLGPNPNRERMDDLDSNDLSDSQLGRGDVEEKIESDEEIGKDYSLLRGGHANPFRTSGDIGIMQDRFEIKGPKSIQAEITPENETKHADILKKIKEETVALKGKNRSEAPRMGNLIEFFSEMAEELIEIDEMAKKQIVEDYSIELQRKISTIATTRQGVEEIIEALETTFLDQIKDEYLIARKNEDDFEKTHPDTHWTSESQAAKEVQNKRITAYENNQEAQTMVEEIVPVLRAIAERLN